MIEAETVARRKSILKNCASADFLELAKTVKELCYSFWTSQPTKAQTSAKVLQTIYKFSLQKEIKAYSEWIDGIAEITRGKLASAIENLDQSSATFTNLEKEYEAAQTQVAKLYALSLLGKYDEAVECGKKILNVFEKFGDEISAGKVEKNLGNIVSRHELHSLAEQFYLAAQARFAKVGNLEELTMVENGLAITYSALNDFRKAEKFYEQALVRAQKAKMFLTEAEIEASMGNLALFRGRLGQALKRLEISRQKYETLKMPHQTAIAELEIADAYLELNLIEESAAIYKTVAEKLQNLKMQSEEARARTNFGRVAVLQKDFRTARKQLKKAARLYVSEKNQVGAATVKIALAHLDLEQKNYQTSLEAANEIEKQIAASENLRHKLAAAFIKAEALRNLNENAQAAEELSTIFADSVKYEQPNTAQAAQISLGKIAFHQKDFPRAKKHFKSAIRLTEMLRAPLVAEEFRMAFTADKLAPFEFLTKIYLSENKLEKAFSMSERARARSLSENLSANFESGEKPKGILGEKLNVLREELNWFYSRLNRAADSEIKVLQIEINKREKQIASVMRQISATTSDSKSLKNGGANRNNFGSATAKDAAKNFRLLQKQIGKGKILIEFMNFEGSISAFVITDKKIAFAASLAKENEILSLLEGLQFQFGALRYGAKNLGNFINDLKSRADFYLNKLYEKLLAPFENYLGNRDLIIVPTDATHYVPFQALFDGEHYTIEKREVTYAPSATIWQFLASKRTKKLDNALLIGYADENIPLVTREIEDLTKIFQTSETFTGERANIEAFTANAPHFDVLHLACHGQFRPENPLFSSLHLADGRLTVRDISAQKLKAELVVLSACETGLNKIFAGEEILGLARGFLSAGAKSLILSLWTVNDEATTELMKKFYEQKQTGKSTAAALRFAQRDFIERGAHPYFWAAFLLIGK